MPALPVQPDLNQLRHQAKDLLRTAQAGDSAAAARIRAVSDRLILSSAQLALAREYGFTSWPRLKLEVERRDILNRRDLSALTRLLAEHRELATARRWSDRNRSEPLGYITKLRFERGELGLVAPSDPAGTAPGAPPGTAAGAAAGTGAIAQALVNAGAPVNGHPGDKETPLITAASYGDAEVAKVLIEAGADIEAVSAPNAGGVPSGNALLHAAVFGMTDVLDLLVGAGAQIDSLEMAAAAGDVSAWPLDQCDLQARLRALVFAADHQRLDVIDQLVAAGTPVNQADAEFQRMPLHVAARHGRRASVRRLLAHGADPSLREPEYHRTPLDECQPGNRYLDGPAHAEVDAILRPLSSGAASGAASGAD
jgi:uncharacterized protein